MASSKYQTPKSVVQELVQATGQSEEDVKTALQECQGDVNEAAQRLLDQPFFKVMSKKDKALKQKKDVPQTQTQREGRSRGNNRQQGRGKGRPSRGSDSIKGESSNFQRQRSTRSSRNYQKPQVPTESNNINIAPEATNELQQVQGFEGQSQNPPQKPLQDNHVNGLNKDDALQEKQQIQQQYLQQQPKQPTQQKVHVIKPGQGSSMAEILKRPKQTQPQKDLHQQDGEQEQGWQVQDDSQLKSNHAYNQEEAYNEEDQYDQHNDYEENGFDGQKDPAIVEQEVGGWADQPPKDNSEWIDQTQPEQIQREKYQKQPKVQPSLGRNIDLGSKTQQINDQNELAQMNAIRDLPNFIQSEFQKQQQLQKQPYQGEQVEVPKHKDSAILQSGPKRSNQQAQTDFPWNQYVNQSANSVPNQSQAPPQQPSQISQPQQQQQMPPPAPNNSLSQPQFHQNESKISQIGSFGDPKYPNLDFAQNFQQSFKANSASQPQGFGNQDGLIGHQGQNQNIPGQHGGQAQNNQNNYPNIPNMIAPLYSLNKLQGSQGLQQLAQGKQQTAGLGQFQINDVQGQAEIGDSIDGQINRIKAQGQEVFQKPGQIHPPNNSHPLYALNNFGDLSNQTDLSTDQAPSGPQNIPIKSNKPQYQDYLQNMAKNVEQQQHANPSIDPKLIENLQNLQQAANSSFGSGLNNPNQQNQLAAQLQSMAHAAAQQNQSKPLNNFLPHPQNLLQHDDVQAASNKLQMLQLKQQLYEQTRQNQVGQGPSPFVGQNEHNPSQHDKEPPSQISKSQLESLQNRLHGFGSQDGPQLDQLQKDQEVGGKLGGEVNQRSFGNLNVGQQNNEGGIFSSSEQSKIEGSQAGQQINNSNQMHGQMPNQNQVWGSMGGVQFPVPMYNQMYNYGGFPFPTPTHPNINPQGHMIMAYMAQNPNLAGQYMPPQNYHQGGYMQPPNFSSQNVQHQNQNQQFQQGNQVHVKYPPHAFVAPPGLAGQAYQGQNSQGFGNQFSNFNNAHNFGSSYSGNNRFQRFNKE